MRTGTRIAVWTVVSAASLTLHVAAFGGLGKVGAHSESRPRKRSTTVEMTVAPKAPPPQSWKTDTFAPSALSRLGRSS